MKAKHLSIRISETQKEALEAAAAREETTVGALVRRAVSGLVSGQRGTVVPQPVRLKRGQRRHRQQELAWLERHRSELGHLQGHYLCIEGSQLIAHDPDLKKVVEEAKRKGVMVPFIERVSERTDAPDYWMGL